MSYATKHYFVNSGNQVDIGAVFCDLTNSQTIGGKKQFSNDVSLNGNVTVNTAGTTFVVTGNVTVGNLNATTNMYINGSAVATQSYVSSNYAPLASPNFSGTPQIGGANIATQSYVTSLGYLSASTAASTYASLASPNFSGTPQIGGANIATQSYVTGLGYLTSSTGFMSLTANQTVSGSNTFTAQQNFGAIGCSQEISLGNGLHVYGGTVTFDTGFNVAGGTVTMNNPKLPSKTAPNVYYLGGRDFGGDYGSTQYTMTNGAWKTLATVQVVAGWYLFVCYVGLGMPSGGGGSFWLNFGITSDSTNVNIANSAHYEYIAFGNGPTYPIHSASFVVEISETKYIYLNALCYGIDNTSLPAGCIKSYGALTAIRLS
jgi:hypothetical protein